MPTSREAEARELILKHGWNSTCYQLLNDGIEHWWSSDRQALVGFVRSGRTAIVAGAPVCAETNLREVIAQWEAFASRQGLAVCYFGAECRLQGALAGQAEYTHLVLGRQPEWCPTHFVKAIASDSSLRAQLNRARNKGVAVSEWSAAGVRSSTAFREVLDEWVTARAFRAHHFLAESNVLDDLTDRRVFVAEHCGRMVGFVVLCPIPGRNGWLTEQFVRVKSAPNGTVELLLHAASSAVAHSESDYFTLGMVPLLCSSETHEPNWLRMLRSWATAHCSRFYNFRGLSDFKSKFHPDRWQPIVVIVKDSRFRVRHARAITGVFTRSAPELAFARAIGRAVFSEVKAICAACLNLF